MHTMYSLHYPSYVSSDIYDDNFFNDQDHVSLLGGHFLYSHNIGIWLSSVIYYEKNYM